MRKLVVTGATSFIGKAMLSKIADWDVIAVVHQGNKPLREKENVHIIELDMEEYHKLGEIVGYADCLVNLAWNGTRGEARMDAELQHKNFQNSVAAIQSVLAAGCKKIVLAGSQAEYGSHFGKITEETSCSPNTEYGKAKLKLYYETMKLCERRAVYIEPRFFSLYGIGDYCNTMIMSTLSKMLENKPCDLTKCVQMWNFMYIDDAIDALLMLCERDCESGAYNFGSEDTRQLRLFVEEMAEVSGTKSSLNFGKVTYPSTGMLSIWPDITKLKGVSNWKPKINFAYGIKTIIEHLKSVSTNF